VEKNKNVRKIRYFNLFPPFCDFPVSAKKRRAPPPPRPPPVAVHELPGFLEEIMAAYRRIVCKTSPPRIGQDNRNQDGEDDEDHNKDQEQQQ
jgi:hypothetical protein